MSTRLTWCQEFLEWQTQTPAQLTRLMHPTTKPMRIFMQNSKILKTIRHSLRTITKSTTLQRVGSTPTTSCRNFATLMITQNMTLTISMSIAMSSTGASESMTQTLASHWPPPDGPSLKLCRSFLQSTGCQCTCCGLLRAFGWCHGAHASSWAATTTLIAMLWAAGSLQSPLVLRMVVSIMSCQWLTYGMISLAISLFWLGPRIQTLNYHLLGD